MGEFCPYYRGLKIGSEGCRSARERGKSLCLNCLEEERHPQIPQIAQIKKGAPKQGLKARPSITQSANPKFGHEALKEEGHPQIPQIAQIKKGAPKQGLKARPSITQGDNPGQGGSPGERGGRERSLSVDIVAPGERGGSPVIRETTIILDRKILAQVARNQQDLVGIVKLQEWLIEVLAWKIEVLEADLEKIGKIRI